MDSFKDFGIKISPQRKAFQGDKIKMDRILNKQIVIEAFKVEPSKAFPEKGSGKCLTLQIIVDNAKRIVFTGSGSLIEMIEQVPIGSFPFSATIIKENEQLEFS